MKAAHDNIQHYVRSKYDLPSDWHIWHYQNMRLDGDWTRESSPQDYIIVTGVICALYKIGAKKGLPNLNTAKRSTERTYGFTRQEFADWCATAPDHPTT